MFIVLCCIDRTSKKYLENECEIILSELEKCAFSNIYIPIQF